jgi:hypothetical protein
MADLFELISLRSLRLDQTRSRGGTQAVPLPSCGVPALAFQRKFVAGEVVVYWNQWMAQACKLSTTNKATKS